MAERFYQTGKLQIRKMTRRDFLRGAGSLAAATAASSILGACDPSESQGFATVEPTYTTVEAYTPLASELSPGTPTPTPWPAVVRFAVIGDYGDSGPDEAKVAELVKSWSPDFIVTTGDNNYHTGKATTIDENIGQYYHPYIYPYKGTYGQGADINRFFPALGGHDWDQPGAEPYLDYFTLPGNGRYYNVRWAYVHIFILDSNDKEPDGNTADSDQAEWLRAAMAASDAPWKLVVAHDPPYSSGRHGSHEVMHWPYREWGATAVLSGDDHDYERIVKEGFPYFVNGLGGARIYDFDADEIVPESVVRFNEEHGAMLVEADAHQIRFQFITASGEVVDDFTMDEALAAEPREVAVRP